jgi:putative heme-binding domain-containing protein
MARRLLLLLAASSLLALPQTGSRALAQTLEATLLKEPVERLVQAAQAEGDPRRGAVLFHQPYLGCTQCHAAGQGEKPLGPDLTRWEKAPTATHLVEAVLQPSRKIREGYQTLIIERTSGQTQTGLLVEDRPDALVLRDPRDAGRATTIPRSEIAEVQRSDQSLMPAGLVNVLASRQQFLDLVSYLREISTGGPAKALELQPDPALYAPPALPEYEQKLDHRALIAGWNDQSLARGEAIYNRVCGNCHGTPTQPGSLPTSLKFASGKFRNGAEPYAMYQTLTRGFGLMAPQTWMVPRQKYDVIHYIRERYLRELNPSQYVSLTDEYLASLPTGDTQGPEPSQIEPWSAMDYGPSLTGTYEQGNDARNFAYKGIAVRLNPGPGGVARGDHFLVFDHDTLRAAAAWSRRPGQPGFIDWHSILFDGQHGVHPRLVGEVWWANRTGPGWARPGTTDFADPRFLGRDGRPYGPLPRDWAQYRGLYHHGPEVITHSTVGETSVYESPGLLDLTAPVVPPPKATDSQSAPTTAPPVITRTLELGPRPQTLRLSVAQLAEATPPLRHLDVGTAQGVLFGTPPAGDQSGPATGPLTFDGSQSAELATPAELDLSRTDLTLLASIQTTAGGSLFCQTSAGEKWVPGGRSLFVRDGRLCFDMGWVGVVTSKQPVADGKPHVVGFTWNHQTGDVELFVDGQSAGTGTLKGNQRLAEPLTRLGYTAGDFPAPQSAFKGQLGRVVAWNGRLPAATLRDLSRQLRDDPAKFISPTPAPVANWRLSGVNADQLTSTGSLKAPLRVRTTGAAASPGSPAILAGISPTVPGLEWEVLDDRLVLVIPAGAEPVRTTVWTTAAPTQDPRDHVVRIAAACPPRDLQALLHGGPPRWPGRLTVPVRRGADTGPLAVDELTLPLPNPWLAQIRPTGLDFHPDGDRLAVCTWDGDVWLVRGLSKLDTTPVDAGPPPTLEWQRIASGLFQPLGLKYIRGKIHLTCRDQLIVLHDLNGDEEIDHYQCLNNDHQVTEHFHEFAMGLQTDAEGNFYYAKSARHALPALVPHHGTLLKVTPDGARTEILATGFRAANGVCLNPDGSFIVTDQEGHWNPKNRINRVEPGKFYGNMYGYHDITDASDSAMQQPLCWITNAFDRSPAELLWVTSPKWRGLEGRLLNFSYGYGKIFVVPHENLDGTWQGGMVELPLPVFPTGLIRGRFSPFDGQLYTCGMFAWAGSATQPGGLYRVRRTDQPLHVPVELHTTATGLRLTFSEPLDSGSLRDEASWGVKVWGLKRSANYGSEHIDEHRLEVTGATLEDDGRTVRLDLDGLQPTWGMEVRYNLRSANGAPVRGVLHNTVHRLPGKTGDKRGQ